MSFCWAKSIFLLFLWILKKLHFLKRLISTIPGWNESTSWDMKVFWRKNRRCGHLSDSGLGSELCCLEASSGQVGHSLNFSFLPCKARKFSSVLPCAEELSGSAMYTVCSVVSSFVTTLSPTKFLCPWNFPDKNTGVGCHFLLSEHWRSSSGSHHFYPVIPFTVSWVPGQDTVVFLSSCPGPACPEQSSVLRTVETAGERRCSSPGQQGGHVADGRKGRRGESSEPYPMITLW